MFGPKMKMINQWLEDSVQAQPAARDSLPLPAVAQRLAEAAVETL